MLFDHFGDLNWLAVIVAAVAFFVVGAIVYAPPVLGKAWQKAIGMTPDQASPSPMLFVGTFVAYVVQAIALGLIIRGLGITEIGDAFVLGLVVGVGILGMGAWVATLYEKRPTSLAIINGLDATLGFIAMSVILTLWD